MDTSGANPLVSAYLERKPDLLRFFRARLRSVAESEDLLQDLYLKILTIPDPGEVRSPGAFLYKLAANLMLDRLRQARRSAGRDQAWRSLHVNDVFGADAAEETPADEALSAKQTLAQLTKALGELPLQTQRVFELHKFDGESHADVAARLGVSKSSVEKHMKAALRHLAVRLRRG